MEKRGWKQGSAHLVWAVAIGISVITLVLLSAKLVNDGLFGGEGDNPVPPTAESFPVYEMRTRPGVEYTAAYFGVIPARAALGRQIEYIVLHDTSTSTIREAMTPTLLGSGQGASHYAIDKDGTVYYLVDEQRVASHAACTVGMECEQYPGACDACSREEYSGMDAKSIGIALVHSGARGEQYTPAQYASLKALIADVASRNGLEPSASTVIGNCHVSRTRGGPSSTFSWQAIGITGQAAC